MKKNFFLFLFLLVLIFLTLASIRGEIEFENRLLKMFWPRTSYLSPFYIPIFSFLLSWILKDLNQKYVWIIFFWISTLFFSYEADYFYRVLERGDSSIKIKDFVALFYGVLADLFLWLSTSLVMVLCTFLGINELKGKKNLHDNK